MIPRIDLMKFPARSAEPHQKLFWSNVLVIFNQSKPRELSHCRLLLSICFRCSKLLPSLWNWYFYQRSCFSFFSGFEEQAGSIGIILELVIDQIIIVPYCYIFFTISSLSFFGTELYLRIVVKAVKVSVYSFNLFMDSQTDTEMVCVKESLKWQRWRWMEGVGGCKGMHRGGAGVRGACYWLSFILRLSLVVFRTEQFWCIWNHVLKHL